MLAGRAVLNWARAWQNQQNDVHPGKTPISLVIHPIWSESSLSAWRKVAFKVTHKAHGENSDQTGRIILLVLLSLAQFATLHAINTYCRLDAVSNFKACNIWATTRPNQQNDVHPAKTDLIRVFAVQIKKLCVLSYPLSTQRRLWSDWEDIAGRTCQLLVLSCCGSYKDTIEQGVFERTVPHIRCNALFEFSVVQIFKNE